MRHRVRRVRQLPQTLAIETKAKNLRRHQEYQPITISIKITLTVPKTNRQENALNIFPLLTVAILPIPNPQKDPNPTRHLMPTMYHLHLDLCHVIILTHHPASVTQYINFNQIKLAIKWLRRTQLVSSILPAQSAERVHDHCSVSELGKSHCYC